MTFALLVAVAGCRAGGGTKLASSSSPIVHDRPSQQPLVPNAPVPISEGSIYQPVTLVSADDSAPEEPHAHSAPEILSESTTPAAADVLTAEQVVEQALEVNPDVRSAIATWRAAAQRYPQQVSLDDPMFGVMLGPGSWGSDEFDDAYTIEASQKLPWPGKRQLRGDIAQAEANAAYFDIDEQRLRIAQVARLAFYEYYLAHRRLALLDESAQLLNDFREIAQSRYEVAAVEQQDVLLADLELADVARRRLELTRQEQVARARINTLLLVSPDAPLPPPPALLPTPPVAASAEQLRATALALRPELAAQQARIRAERYAVELACREFYPDVEVVGRYDAFWQEEPLRPMVGMNLNVPLYKQRRWAAVAEARARIAKEQAEYDAQTVEIAFEVERTYRLVQEAASAIGVYQSDILPTARHSIDAARASYLAGRADFLRLVESQRRLLDLEEQYHAAVADYQQRLAELHRTVGESPIVAGSDSN